METIGEIALELERLVSEIASINTRPFNERIDIQAFASSDQAPDEIEVTSGYAERMHS